MYPRRVKLLSHMYNRHLSAGRRKRVGSGSILSFQLGWANWSESDLSMEMETGLHTFGSCSLRRYIGYAREDTLLERLRSLLSKVNTHGFEIVSLQPHIKDGGVFVKFRYSATDTDAAQETIVDNLRKHVHSHGGVPSWFGLPQGEVWLVKGTPWREVSILHQLTSFVIPHSLLRGP